MMKTVFGTVWEMSLSGGAVILAVLLCRMLLNRCPKKVTVFLWLPAALQLVLPVSVPFALSFFNLLPRKGVRYSEVVMPDTLHAVENAGMTADVPVQSVLPAPSPAPLMPDPAQLWNTVGTVLWLAGMVVMLIWAAVQYGRLMKCIQTAVLMDGERNVYQSENIRTPFIRGILRPKIYVPYDMDSVTAWQVLAHEHTHLRFGDHLTKSIAFLILTLHWFNPLCWIAFVLFGRDVEMRCDEAVLVHSDAKEYGTALVRMAAERRYRITGPLAFGETSVKERVKHILTWKKPALWLTAAAVVLCAMVGIVCATDAMETPYVWTSTVTAEDFTNRDVTLHGYGMYEAEFTDAQLEKLAESLRNVPESAMRIRWKNTISSQKLINYTIEGRNDYTAALLWDGERVILSAVQQISTIRMQSSSWYLKDPALETFFAELEAAILAGQG
ncbi:MAG: M56 family metallopeptidase, partial [Clostridia bacterium]|nr:M56 family metallopeptidase [Clostridia bacterium]